MWGQELSHGTVVGLEHPEPSQPRQMFFRSMLMPQVGLLFFWSLGLAHWCWEPLTQHTARPGSLEFAALPRFREEMSS